MNLTRYLRANMPLAIDTNTLTGGRASVMLPFPMPLMYVTVKLDTVGSVMSLEDETATLDAGRIPTKTYVAYVGAVCV